MKFCKPDGKGPDKRFAQSELQESAKVIYQIMKITGERGRERERADMKVRLGNEAHSIGIEPER